MLYLIRNWYVCTPNHMPSRHWGHIKYHNTSILYILFRICFFLVCSVVPCQYVHVCVHATCSSSKLSWVHPLILNKNSYFHTSDHATGYWCCLIFCKIVGKKAMTYWGVQALQLEKYLPFKPIIAWTWDQCRKAFGSGIDMRLWA